MPSARLCRVSVTRLCRVSVTRLRLDRCLQSLHPQTGDRSQRNQAQTRIPSQVALTGGPAVALAGGPLIAHAGGPAGGPVIALQVGSAVALQV